MTTTADQAAQRTLPPAVPFDGRSDLRRADDGMAGHPQPATVVVMVHVLGIVGVLVASLPTGLLLLTLSMALGILGVLALQSLALVWFLWLLRITAGRREELDDDEVVTQQALGSPATTSFRVRAPRSRDRRPVGSIIGRSPSFALRG